MRVRGYVNVVVALSCLLPAVEVCGQGMLVRGAGEKVVAALSRYFVNTSGRELGAELVELGGREGVEAISSRVVRETGEEGMTKVIRLVDANGPDVIRALDNTPSLPSLLKAVDELPADQLAVGISRLAAGANGKTLGELVERYGVTALRAEIAHPGVGTKMIAVMGDDGIRLSQKLGTGELIEVAKHADDIVKLPGPQKSKILELIYSDTERMVKFMGRFVEKNPGKVLFTGATTAVILTNPEKVFGASEMVIDKDGNPYIVERTGFLERAYDTTLRNTLKPVFIWVAPFIALGLTIIIGMKLWPLFRIGKIGKAAPKRRPKS